MPSDVPGLHPLCPTKHHEQFWAGLGYSRAVFGAGLSAFSLLMAQNTQPKKKRWFFPVLVILFPNNLWPNHWLTIFFFTYYSFHKGHKDKISLAVFGHLEYCRELSLPKKQIANWAFDSCVPKNNWNKKLTRGCTICLEFPSASWPLSHLCFFSCFLLWGLLSKLFQQRFLWGFGQIPVE